MSKQLAIMIAMAMPTEVLIDKVEEGFARLKGELLIGKPLAEIDEEIVDKLSADLSLLGMKLHIKDDMKAAMDVMKEISIMEKFKDLLPEKDPSSQN